MLKNGLFLTILLLIAASSFAQDIRNRYLYLDGSGTRMDQVDFFKRSLTMEANGTGYIITNTMAEALHTLRFRVSSNYDMEYEQYVITLSLHRNEDSSTLVSFDYAFSSIDETYPFMRTLFLNSVTPIPLPLLTEENAALERGNHWYKWIYFRASFDFPISLYLVKKNGLISGALYDGTADTPTRFSSPLDNIFTAAPGATVGVEFQLLNFMCLEVNFQMNMGDTRNKKFINMGAGAELKFPIKLRTFMLVPYGAFTYFFKPSPVFAFFPPFTTGGGIQMCMRAGKLGILFVDVQYMFAFTDAIMHNPYLAYEDPAKRFYPEPAVIHYKRSYLGVKVGYKIGIIDRKKKVGRIIY